ncbi:type II secretion system protein [Candidatus Uhrbacteria bacterium]|nr:type II secretion system protein [Candidatus Uhrbacteria bacterium]
MKGLRKGFTLLELLVVIAIIGILASIAVVSFSTARSKARDAKKIGNWKALQTAMTLYYDDFGIFPPSGTTPAPGAVNASLPVAAFPARYMNTSSITDVNWSKPGKATDALPANTLYTLLENPNKDICGTTGKVTPWIYATFDVNGGSTVSCP